MRSDLKIVLNRKEREIVVHGVMGKTWPFAESLPGGRFVRKDMTWRFPMTQFMAIRIYRMFSSMRSLRLELGPKFDSYLEAARRAERVTYLDTKDAALTELIDIPITRVKPWDHQRRVYHYAFPREAVLFDMDMGVGKSKLFIDLIMNRRHKTVLLGAPNRVLSSLTWEEHFAKHWDLRAGTMGFLNLHEGSIPTRAEHMRDFLETAETEFKIVGLNYEVMWVEPIKSIIKGRMWNLIGLDECHRIKGAGSRVSAFFSGLVNRAEYRIGMSGTALAQTILDAYGQFRFLDPGIFGTQHAPFAAAYGVFGGFENRELIGVQNEDDFRRKYHSIAFTITEDDGVVKLPPMQELFRYCQFTPGQRRQYKQMEKTLIAEIKQGIITAENGGVKVNKLQQMTSGHLIEKNEWDKSITHEFSTAKEELLEEVLSEIKPKTAVVVFYRFKHDLVVIKRVCARLDRGIGEVSGAADNSPAWKAGEFPILAVQVQAGSEGIDLTRARYGIFYSMPRSRKDYRQARKRIHRPGQTRTTSFIYLFVENTLDPVIKKGLDAATDLINYVLTYLSED